MPYRGFFVESRPVVLCFPYTNTPYLVGTDLGQPPSITNRRLARNRLLYSVVNCQNYPATRVTCDDFPGRPHSLHKHGIMSCSPDRKIRRSDVYTCRSSEEGKTLEKHTFLRSVLLPVQAVGCFARLSLLLFCLGSFNLACFYRPLFLSRFLEISCPAGPKRPAIYPVVTVPFESSNLVIGISFVRCRSLFRRVIRNIFALVPVKLFAFA